MLFRSQTYKGYAAYSLLPSAPFPLARTSKRTRQQEHLPLPNHDVLELTAGDIVRQQSSRRRYPLPAEGRVVDNFERHAPLDLVEPLLRLVEVVICEQGCQLPVASTASERAPLRELGPPTTMTVKSPPSYLRAWW